MPAAASVAESRAQLLVEAVDQLLDALVDADLGGCARPEATWVRIVIDTRHDRVAEQAKRRALRVRQAHAVSLLGVALGRHLSNCCARVQQSVGARRPLGVEKARVV
jgi:hypothetical protein